MLKSPLLLVSALALVAPSSAQMVTSPKGLDSTEGNAFFFASTNRRYQSIDNTLANSTLLIKSFHLRRDKSRASRAGKSTALFTLEMGEADMSVVCADMDCNYLSGTRKTVFARKQVNWPDWAASSPTPAPFDFGVTLNTVHIYSSKNAFVWDLTLQRGTNTGNIFDRDYVGYSSGTGTDLNAGCGRFTISTQMQSNGTALKNFGMRFRVYGANAPPSTPVSWSLALKDSNLTIPGFCTTLHAVPVLTLPLASDSSGRVPALYFNTPFDAKLNGLNIVSQAFTTSGGNLVMSNATSTNMPSSSATTGHEACYLWSSLLGSTTFVFTGGSIVARLGL